MSIEKEKTIDHRMMYEGKLLHVYYDKVDIAGETYRRELVEHPGAAAIIPVTEDREILFVKQYRYPIKQALLEIPAGKLASGEDPGVCAVRELEEETGCIGTLRKTGIIYTTPGFCNEKIYLYIADHLVYTHQHLDDGEYLDIVKIPLKEVFQMVHEGEITDAKTLSALAIASDILHSMI